VNLRHTKTLTIIGVICLILLPAIYAHVRIAGDDQYRGALAMLDRVFDLAFVCALAILIFAIGRRLASSLQLTFLSLAEELSFSIMLGTGTLALLVLVFGLAGMLKPLPIAILILVTLVFLRSELAAFPELGGRLLTVITQNKLASGLFAFVAVVLVIRALTPPWAIDEVIYHLPATKSFVEAGRIYPLYHRPLGNMPFLVHMIYALCLLVEADTAARLFSLLLTLITAIALYAFCRRFLTRQVGLVALFGFLSASMVVEVGISTRIDVSLAGMLFLATYAMIVYLESRKTGWLIASGILSGFSLGIKLNAALWLGCLGLMFLVESLIRRRTTIAELARNTLLYAAIALAVSSPWLIKNLIWFHNPIYPFISGELASFDQGEPRYFTAEDEQKLDAHFDAAKTARPQEFQVVKQKLDQAARDGIQRHPMRFWEYYTQPHKYFMGDYHHYPSYLFLVLPFLLFVPRNRWVTWLLLVSVVVFFMLSSTSWIARFLLMIYPALTIVSAYTLVQLCNRFAGRRAEEASLLVVAALLMLQIGVSGKFISSMGNLKFLSGETSRHEFLSGLFYYPPIAFMNESLPANAGVFSLGGEMCYHLQRPYISDGSWDATEWRRLLIRNATLEAVNNDLKRQGISHVLFAPWYFELIAKTGWPKPGGSRFLGTGKFTDDARVLEFGPDYTSLRNWETFDRYRSEFLELIYTDRNGYAIYRLK
jgi:Dolichyl-phosphate-mannose-protein mannosyltransferase